MNIELKTHANSIQTQSSKVNKLTFDVDETVDETALALVVVDVDVVDVMAR